MIIHHVEIKWDSGLRWWGRTPCLLPDSWSAGVPNNQYSHLAQITELLNLLWMLATFQISAPKEIQHLFTYALLIYLLVDLLMLWILLQSHYISLTQPLGGKIILIGIETGSVPHICEYSSMPSSPLLLLTIFFLVLAVLTHTAILSDSIP